MLDPWIIEQIRRREEEERQRQDRQPVLEIQDEDPFWREEQDEVDEPSQEPERGVSIVNFTV